MLKAVILIGGPQKGFSLEFIQFQNPTAQNFQSKFNFRYSFSSIITRYAEATIPNSWSVYYSTSHWSMCRNKRSKRNLDNRLLSSRTNGTIRCWYAKHVWYQYSVSIFTFQSCCTIMIRVQQKMKILKANFKISLFSRYLQEFTMLGTAGGMYHFRDQIRSCNPTAFFVLNGDVCSDFPLSELYEFHKLKSPQAMVGTYKFKKSYYFPCSLEHIVSL